MNFKYNKLKGAMVEQEITQGQLAKELDIAQETLSLKLNNHNKFKQEEIYKIMKILGLKNVEEYFFTI